MKNGGRPDTSAERRNGRQRPWKPPERASTK
nr:MAG TPA: hypothetical protein [Caudoviricetes sp.]